LPWFAFLRRERNRRFFVFLLTVGTHFGDSGLLAGEPVSVAGSPPPHAKVTCVWLVRDGEVLATAELAATRRERARGLLGRSGYEGALVFRKVRQVHTVGMRFAIDVAFCDAHGRVLRTVTMRPWRLSRVVWKSALVIEAEAGAFERWGLRAGDHVDVKD
jgi:uncharacterized membrane protein (UPF0127 family)